MIKIIKIIKIILNNIIFMYKGKTETAPAVFLPKCQKPAHPYRTNFSKLSLTKINFSIKQIKIQNICKRSIPFK